MTRIGGAAVLGLMIWLTSLGLGAIAHGGTVNAQSRESGQQILVFLKLPPRHFSPNADYSDAYGDGPGRGARRRLASRLAHDHGLTLADDWPLPLLGVDCFVMTVPADRSVDEAAAALSRAAGVAWSEPVHLYHAQRAATAPNDPLFRAQPAAREWRLADLHEIATGRGVLVAVIDSGIEKTHPDLLGQVRISEDFVAAHPGGAEQHGTGVAGIIAAVAGNGVGIVGVAPEARLMALRACWQGPLRQDGSADTVCDSLSLAKALHFAVLHGAKVINLSLSGPPDALLAKLLDVALDRGATIVGALDRNLPGGGFPASHPGVVGVVAESLDAPPAGIYSAPGRDVPTTQPGGRWFLVNGSSFAAAHVSGLFALLRERAPRIRGSTALVTFHPGGGAIDACATLLRASGPCDCACSRVHESPAILGR